MAEPSLQIITRFDPPPIPVRTCDWCAHLDGQEEDGPHGWGSSEEAAIAELKDRLDECA